MADAPLSLTAVLYEESDGIARVTLNRPDALNSFNTAMQDDLETVWHHIKFSKDVRAVILTGAGDRAFSTGIDRSEIPEVDYDPFSYEDPGLRIGPKSAGVWKPIIAAVNGMACGGGFYLLGECDILIAAEEATFFDPHVTFSMTAVYEPLLLLPRMPFGEVVRMALTGSYERMSAAHAQAIGLVSEVVPRDELLAAAEQLAHVIAIQPPRAIQATLRSLWAARDLAPGQTTALGNIFLQLGTTADSLAEGNRTFETKERPKWRLR